MAAGNSPIVRNYDKIAAVICLVLFGLMLYIWMDTKGSAEVAYNKNLAELDSLTPERPEVPPQDKEILLYSNSYTRIGHPFQINFRQDVKSGFFVPEKRVWCAHNSCQAPIPPESEKCPRCGTEQPLKGKVAVADASTDSDSDGIPDIWERKYNLNHLDASDAASDADEDGFSNLQEFRAGSNPLDKNSHPDPMTFVCVRSIEATKLPIMFTSTLLMPDKTYKCQFNYYDRETKKMVTLMIKEGELLGPLPALPGAGLSAPKRYADFKLQKIDWREEKVINKFTKKEKVEKVPVAVVERISTKRMIEFRKEVEATDTDYRITLVQSNNGAEFVLEGSEGEAEVTINGKKFLLKKIDKGTKNIVLMSMQDKKEISIPAEAEVPSAETPVFAE